jgi:hypothetical protein
MDMKCAQPVLCKKERTQHPKTAVHVQSLFRKAEHPRHVRHCQSQAASCVYSQNPHPYLTGGCRKCKPNRLRCSVPCDAAPLCVHVPCSGRGQQHTASAQSAAQVGRPYLDTRLKLSQRHVSMICVGQAVKPPSRLLHYSATVKSTFPPILQHGQPGHGIITNLGKLY